jgi:hypothetical protein
VPSCLEKSKFAAICKPAIRLELRTEACNGMRDLAQSVQALGTLTHKERLRLYTDAALGLQRRVLGNTLCKRKADRKMSNREEVQ